MEKTSDEIRLSYTNLEINEMLKSPDRVPGSWSCHYNQNEGFFLKLPKAVTVPHFPVYHKIEQTNPSADYLKALKSFLSDVVSQAPQVFEGLTYFFDPAEIFHPCFFQLYKLGDLHFLYLVRLDLSYKANEAEIVGAGTNDITHKFVTNHLFIECDFIPLDEVVLNNGRVQAFKIKQYISQTWIGETGRGYFLQGIWMDEELTRFFSRLFIPAGRRSYPYFPFTCKYKTVCHTVINVDPDGRKRHLPYLIKAIDFLNPRLMDIQKSLKNKEFNEALPEFIKMKKEVPEYWSGVWGSLVVTPYLNDKDMKEFLVEFRSN